MIKEKTREELSNELRKAIGYRSISQFAKDCRMVDVSLIVNILDKRIVVLPEREVLRTIERASEGRVTYTYLCQICGYSKYDSNEDKTWATYQPERGSVYMADLGLNNMDSEQEGVRPVLIVSNETGNKYGSIITVAPLTSQRKRKLPIHVELNVDDGMRRDSLICLEQTRAISKRRLFYNGVPIKVLKLSEAKIEEVNTAIEKQFGLIDCLFNNEVAFELIEQIETLEQNIKTKKIKPSFLSELLNGKRKELIAYYKKYNKNENSVIKNYEGTREFMPLVVGG
ncbi:MAG: type II toxin-antitoxin system PemK/MazF family toxin [Clostridium sp.]|uniref:type II toxin-antitoxin system PemK/MazF family toxin n=1 Tax=Clostridium sp. TaxID=1506 RepID=UPI0025BB23E7|nr:type II toxin-antitoxin system PemK/MazF family toxin [Clostridium sp.]MCE5220166.1 type II toxin-antitoxin system PemK/MazF family toxin [Clostridium sp.]